MSKHHRRRQIKAEINIVPFLDVLLVLLLIFMATAPVINQSVRVELPDAQQTENLSSENVSAVILEVPDKGQYRLTINGKAYNDLSTKEAQSLASAEHKRNPKAVFLVGGARTVAYQEVVDALDLLHSAGIKSVGLMTHAINEGK